MHFIESQKHKVYIIYVSHVHCKKYVQIGLELLGLNQGALIVDVLLSLRVLYFQPGNQVSITSGGQTRKYAVYQALLPEDGTPCMTASNTPGVQQLNDYYF